MIKKFKDFFNKHTLRYEQEVPKTQKELDLYMLTAIDDDSYESFVDAIERGADINRSVDTGKGYLIDALTSCVMLSRIKMLKYLINKGVDIFNNNNYNYIMKMMIDKKDRKEIFNVISKKYPNFEEELAIRKDAKKYNL